MVERTCQDRYACGVNTWRAGCGGSRTSGSEGGPRKPTGRKTGRAPRSDPYTEHPTAEEKLYRAAVMDVYSRLIVGWSIDDNMRTELVIDALGMAIVRRRPEDQPGDARTIAHSEHGSRYTWWAFGKRLREAGLLGSMGSVGDCYDCETVLRRSSRCDPCYDWPCGCPGVDLSAGSSDAPEVARRAGSDLIGA
jgi:transposase InsO family protein